MAATVSSLHGCAAHMPVIHLSTTLTNWPSVALALLAMASIRAFASRHAAESWFASSPRSAFWQTSSVELERLAKLSRMLALMKQKKND